ncbi:MAG TPA: AMP-binding protein [Burkholderiales bacterium]|nr:AMP-binding protein [Burkholderiales bacterium]
MPPADIPLVHGHDRGSVFAYRERRPLGLDEFLRDTVRLAARLPQRRHVLNLCADRYRFAVGFSAALLREQVSLLPPNDTPDLIERLVALYPDVYCLTDGPAPPVALETVFFPDAAGAGPGAPAVPAVPETRVAAIVFTSGSTGEPVPYPKTWGSLARSARAEIDRLDTRRLPGMAVLGTVPPQHSYGLESTVLMAMQGGLAMHAGRPFYPADIREQLASLPKPRCLVTTPVHLRVLLAEPDELPPADLLLCATASLAPQLAARAEARFNAPLFEIYGCTEAGQVATRRTVQSSEWRALPGIKLRTRGGRTWVHGGHVETEVLLTDVIEMRGREKFLLHGRTADLVNIAGKRTSLAHLNYQLNSIEGVLDGVFVVPVQQGEAVARLMAFAVAPGHTGETLMKALRQRIDPAFLPRPLCLVDVLPRNATGKLPRERLDRLAAGLGAAGEPGRP